MKKFKKLLKEGNSKKIKKFVQKKMDKIDRLEYKVEYLSDYACMLSDNYHELEQQLMEIMEKETEPEENSEEKKSCCDENCCKEN